MTARVLPPAPRKDTIPTAAQDVEIKHDHEAFRHGVPLGVVGAPRDRSVAYERSRHLRGLGVVSLGEGVAPSCAHFCWPTATSSCFRVIVQLLPARSRSPHLLRGRPLRYLLFLPCSAPCPSHDCPRRPSLLLFFSLFAGCRWGSESRRR